ncbi:large ribosomal subunit protein cL38 [Humulus lupulus]|uniref:large ribosomal subunit protein cL38 n=1 Tax=Humulus lupulus TaxID=3486 RepID=UPI002B402C6A|nr:large ribosomal subunit protein cL38 [Humulus lupulus]
MSTSALFGAQLVSVRNPLAPASVGAARPALSYGGGLAVIECSSRPTKKSTAHHRKTRPRKTQQWDIKRKPTVYAPLPQLPPEWTLAATDDSFAVAEADVSPPAPESPAAE